MFENVRRFATEHISSVNNEALLYQSGRIKSKVNTAYFYIPCGIENIKNLVLAPINSTNSANLVAFASLYEITNSTSVKTNLDTWATTTAYEEDQMVYDSVTTKAYICGTAHTSNATAFATDLAAGKWIEVPYTKFIKITATAAGATKVTDVLYTITGEGKIVE